MTSRDSHDVTLEREVERTRAAHFSSGHTRYNREKARSVVTLIIGGRVTGTLLLEELCDV